VDSVARLMTRKHIHRVIVQRGRKVAGIISALDVLRLHTGDGVAPARGAAAKKAARPKVAAARRRKAVNRR
jgi:signal-transduction protein with cAMP-binding, CBS, and nucleotidyltransferase domain